MADNISRDDSMDLESLIKHRKEIQSSEKVSPLQKAIQTKNENESGIIVDDDKQKQQPLRNNLDTEERDEDFKETLTEQTASIDKAKLISVIKKPTNEAEDAAMMDEINRVTIDENGNAVVPENAEYIISKNNIPTQEQIDELSKEKEDETDEEEVTTSTNAKDEKEKMVQMIIDKTGLGKAIELTDDEEKEINISKRVNIVAVEDKKIGMITSDRSFDETQSFADNISAFQYSVSRTHMNFPLSGFSADLSGLSIGEIIDISLPVSQEDREYENFNVDKILRGLSVVYNHLINITTGKFKSFEDFLRKFAWADYEIAVYALLISTEEDTSTVELDCRNPNCGKGYEYVYPTRSLINIDKASTGYLKLLDKLASSNGATPIDTLRTAPVRTVKKFKISERCIVEIGPINAYDYVYEYLPRGAQVLKYREELRSKMENNESIMGEDITRNEREESALSLISAIRGFDIKDADGKWTEVHGVNNILTVIMDFINGNEFNMITGLALKAMSEYEISFSIKGARCPYCNQETNEIEVTPTTVLFLLRQRTRSIEQIFDTIEVL